MYTSGAAPGAWKLMASPDARDGSALVHQDVTVTLGKVDAKSPLTHPLAPGRHAWLQVLRGEAGAIPVAGEHGFARCAVARNTVALGVTHLRRV